MHTKRSSHGGILLICGVLVVGVGAVVAFVIMFFGVLDSSTGSGPAVKYTHDVDEARDSVTVTVRDLGGADRAVIQTPGASRSVSTAGLRTKLTVCQSYDTVQILAYEDDTRYSIGTVSVGGLSGDPSCG